MAPVVTPLRSAPDTARDRDEDLVARAWNGDDHSLGLLLHRYRGFVRSKARSYFLVGADREDVVQEGMIGLYKAIRDFDAARESSFRAFAELCVNRQILSAVKSATRRKHGPLNSYVSIHGPSQQDDEPDHDLVDSLVVTGQDPAECVVSASELAALEAYFGDMLSELEADVLQRYVEGQTYAEIAVQLDRHVKAIDNALQRIKRKVGTYLVDRKERESA